MGPKRLSGSAFRKLKKRKEEASKKLVSSLGNWLRKDQDKLPLEQNPQDGIIPRGHDNECNLYADKGSQRTPMEVITTSEEENDSEFCNFELDSCSMDLDKACSSGVNKTSTPSNVEIQYEDPNRWPTSFRSDAVRLKLVQLGPQTVDVDNYKFPFSDDGRHFSSKWFFKDLSNGERVKRQWMLYSQSKDALFCFPCLLFSKDIKSPFSNVEKGFNDWKHLNPLIQTHETSSSHRHSYMEWKELEIRLKTINCIDADIQKHIQLEEEKWRNVLKVIVDVILHCARNNLPLRGGSDSISDKNCGVFLSTLELVSHYHPQLCAHIEKIKTRKNVLSYFSPQTQNEIIELLGNKVRSVILDKIKTAKYYSIMFDCTPDTARLEQMSQIIRYVHIKDGNCTIEESFVDFIVSHNKTGKGLSEEILEKLKDDGLDIQNCRGQGFDNGSNMAGKYEGVQAHISHNNELAKFVPCAAHSLNLVGVHAAEVSVMMISFFEKVQTFFNFFSNSTARWESLLRCTNTTLKRHGDTRWSSKRQAVTALEKNLKSVHNVLHEMTNRDNWNTETVCGAINALKQIDYKFVCLLQMWCDILIKIDCTNKSLQGKCVTIDVAARLLFALKKNIQSLRDEGIQKYTTNAKAVCEAMDIEGSFPMKRARKAKRMAGELADDEGCLLTAEDSFRNDCFEVFDRIMSEMEKRSEVYDTVSSDFSFLSGKVLYESDTSHLEKCAADLGIKYSRDIDSVELGNEVASFKFQAAELLENIGTASHLDFLNCITKYGLRDAYPNIEIALRIFLTMPVSVASCERSFSKLKVIKNYLRSSMTETRLTNLAILSIEYELASKIDFNDIINEFSSIKTRKMKF